MQVLQHQFKYSQRSEMTQAVGERQSCLVCINGVSTHLTSATVSVVSEPSSLA